MRYKCKYFFLKVFILAFLYTNNFSNANLIKREILALYLGSETENIAYHPLHLYAELPLNHLGLKVSYWDIEKGLPDLNNFPECRGILTWFLNGKMKDPINYLKWAAATTEKGFKFVILGHLGVEENLNNRQTSLVYINLLLNALGIERKDQWISPQNIVKLNYNSSFEVSFERPVATVRKGIYLQNLKTNNGRTLLSSELKDGQNSDLIIVTNKGAYASEGYFLFTNEDFKILKNNLPNASWNAQWYLNPFIFFKEAFSANNFPKPDITTFCGKRIYFSHVNGNGWNERTEIQKYKNQKLLASEIILKKIIKTYPELPITIGPIAAELDPLWQGNPKSQEIAREIFAYPHVEAASHSYSHPEDWSFYTKKRTIDEEKKEITEGNVTRTYLNYPFNLDTEISESVKYLKQFLPPSKEINLFLWSGDYMPTPEAIQKVKNLKLQNLNGGLNRLDAEYPSYTALSPYGRKIGDNIQIYASGSNENSYTFGWTDRFFGLKFLTNTILNSEHPLRTKPINLYYNIFSGKKKSSLSALEEVIDYVRQADIIPVKASLYTQIVEGFYSTSFFLLGENHYEIRNRGSLQTIRFDQASYMNVDFENSKGVIGFKHYQGSLYVALDPNYETPVILLEHTNKLSFPPHHHIPYLLDSHWQISDLSASPQLIEAMIEGFGSGKMRWVVPEIKQYKLVFLNSELEKEIGVFNTNGDNILEIFMKGESLIKGKIKLIRIDKK